MHLIFCRIISINNWSVSYLWIRLITQLHLIKVYIKSYIECIVDNYEAAFWYVSFKIQHILKWKIFSMKSRIHFPAEKFITYQSILQRSKKIFFHALFLLYTILCCHGCEQYFLVSTKQLRTLCILFMTQFNPFTY